MDKPAAGKPVRMFSIKCFLGDWEKKKKGDRRRISLQKLIYFQRLNAAPGKSDPKYPFRKKKEKRETP